MKNHAIFVRRATLVCAVLCIASSIAPITYGQRFDRGGGGGGSRPNISGGARPSLGGVNRPSGGMPSGINRPSGGMPSGINRPSGGGLSGVGGNSLRPTQPATRPAQPSTRPGAGSFPSLGGTARPQVPNIQTPGLSRPNPGGVQRPTTNIPRPGSPDLGSRPSLQVPGSVRPTTRPSFPGSGIDRPTRPNVPERPQTLPGRPPTNITRPSFPDRPQTLPGRPPTDVTRPSFPERPQTLPGRPPTGITRPNLPERPQTLPGRPPAGITRPNLPERPQTLPGRPPTGITRPSFPDRPGFPNRPGYPDRPGGNDWWRPGYPDRPINNDRPIIGNRPDRPIIGGGNLGIGGGNININNNVNNWFGNSNWGWNTGWNTGWNSGWNTGWNTGWYRPSWYNGHWNAHWGTSWYRPMPNYYVGWGLGSWATYSTFVNPYYVPSTTTIYNYAEPIVINSVARSAPDQSVERVPAEPDADTVALELFDEGVAAFHDGKFELALNKFDTAMHRLSGDPVLHEMRALTLFALGKFQESAAVLNALLATSPGMDWTTLSGLYGDIDLYTQQLRKLESHIESNPKDAAALFVLAYHYLVTGHLEDAVELLADVVELQPNDTTASQMLRALTAADDQTQTPDADQSRPAKAVDVSRVATAKKADDSAQADDDQPKTDLVGKWIATPTGVTITLEVTETSTFTWRAEPKAIDDKPAAEPMELSGDVLAGGDTLILNTETQGAMTGRVESRGADQFRFIVPGGPPDDPGLTFDRQK